MKGIKETGKKLKEKRMKVEIEEMDEKGNEKEGI